MPAFSGGEALQKKLQEIAEKIGNRNLRVGFLEGATYPDGTSVPMVAALLNYGTSKMPPRPFFENMIRDKSLGWSQSLETLCKLHDYDMPKVLALMGEGIKGQLQQAIVDFTDPQDSDATKKRKAFAHPDSSTLIETAHMLASVDYEVKE